MDKKQSQLVIGVMSGTSLDGLDIALCEFKPKNKGINYSIIKAKTIKYSPILKKQLIEAKNASAEHYFKFNSQYGQYIGKQINLFLKSIKTKPHAIASHGHTVFHQPKLGFTTQIGCGANVAATTNITTVCDFRSLDVALKGQGAPLVPIGDELLFNDFDACLNIGGIANISFKKNGKRLAYDICEANMLLNYLSEKLGQAYDKNGSIAKAGIVNQQLLKELNQVAFYKKIASKSIGREWFENTILPIVNKNSDDDKNKLATATLHVATIIANDLNKNNIKHVLITGGGAHNKYLINAVKQKTTCQLHIPNKQIIDFKEALIFAFLGYLRLTNTTNTLKTVTAASTDSIGGAVYIINK
jgi:anhydro-N-acetylmuramic acid kinase